MVCCFSPVRVFKVLLEFLIFSALSIRSAFRHSSGLSIHLESRSTMNASSFYRYLSISMITTITSGLASLLSFTGPSLHPWSWDTVHASMSEVNIVSSREQVGFIQLAWWGGFVVTVLYLLLSYCLGEETRDIFKWIKQKTSREESFVLPMQCVLSCHFSKLTQFFLSGNKRKPRVFSSQFKSGWDDMLDGKVPKAKIKSSLRLSTCSSPISEDDHFKTSTLSYLGSPTAKTLGLSGVPQNVAEKPNSRTSSPVFPAVHRAADSSMSAPPNVPLPSRPESCYGSVSRSRSPSNLFLDETIGTLTPLLSLFPKV